VDSPKLEAAVRPGSLDWVVDVSKRLDVIVELIDSRFESVLPMGTGPDAVEIRRRLSTREAGILAGISNVQRGAPTSPVSVEGFAAMVFGVGRGTTLLLARAAGTNSIAEHERDLELIGSWLAGALERSLNELTNGISIEPYRIVSLRRILNEAMSRGSVRSVIGAFVEAVGVWSATQVRVYAAGAYGGFLQYVTPVATASSSVPSHLDESAVPRQTRLVRLARDEAERIGWSEPNDLHILWIVAGNSPWLLTFSGAVDRREHVRLTLYSDILRELLNDVFDAAMNRVRSEMRRHEIPQNEPAQMAQTALEHLLVTLSASQAGLVWETASGAQTLAVGSTDLLTKADQPGPDCLVVRSTEAGERLIIAIARQRPPFAMFERELIEAGAATLHSVLRQVVQRPIIMAERRRRASPVDVEFERIAAETVHEGRHASIILVSAGAAQPGTDLLVTWLGDIRAQLRPGDYAAILNDKEIAVLLCGSSAPQASAVAERLKTRLSNEKADIVIRPLIGISTSSPDSSFMGSVVAAARSDAASVH
jgi:hypothetical protein